ncbi:MULTISPECIES: hypothetical protein [Mesorhizobium]|uniref:hypothetical protein n=1 Tax=Mesorhizobium TaxID=68287 RepID=UPI001FCEC8AC|nr:MULTISPECIES: hypothetical protein [Mesorhizobium]
MEEPMPRTLDEIVAGLPLHQQREIERRHQVLRETLRDEASGTPPDRTGWPQRDRVILSIDVTRLARTWILPIAMAFMIPAAPMAACFSA